MTTTLRPHRLSVSAAVALVLCASGCGAIAERATEEAVERGIESEGGGDVNVEFDSDSGTFNVEGKDGDATFSIDEDGIRIEGTDADGNDFSLDADENGVKGETENGESITFDQDGFTTTDENGDVTTGEFDTDGDSAEIVVEGDDGGVFRIGEDFPAEWPGDVPRPDGLTDLNTTYQSDAANVFIVVAGRASDGVDSFADGYISDLESAGFVEESTYSAASTRGGTYTRGGENMAVNVTDSGSGTDVAITYALSE